jgi:hypothetical protein
MKEHNLHSNAQANHVKTQVHGLSSMIVPNQHYKEMVVEMTTS